LFRPRMRENLSLQRSWEIHLGLEMIRLLEAIEIA
jgi:hypothetical protein